MFIPYGPILCCKSNHITDRRILSSLKIRKCFPLLITKLEKHLDESYHAIGHKVRGFKPGREQWIFKGDKNP
jgi:hypothetical protein